MTIFRFASRLLIAFVLATAVGIPVGAQTVSSFYTVPTVSALAAMTTRPATVYVQGQASATDLKGGLYNWVAGSATTANGTTIIAPSGAGPAGRWFMQAATGMPAVASGGTVARSMADHLADVVYAKDYGAVCDGTTDDQAAIQAAMSGGIAKTVVLPSAVCRLGATLIVPPSVELEGSSFLPSYPPQGSILLCDASVTPCLQVGQTAVNSSQGVRRLVVSRAGGEPTADKEGIRTYGYNNTIVDVMAYNQGIGFNLTSQPADGIGLGAQLTRIYSGAISGTHLQLDGIPEVRISQGRLGMNGNGDYNGDAFITIKGGAGGTAGGPNTFNVENVQFNQGNGTGPDYWIKFVDCASTCVPSIDARMWRFTDVHVEGLATAGVFSDSSWNVISGFFAQGLSFNNPTKPFWALNAATTLTDVGFFGAVIQASSFNVSPSDNISNLSIVGSSIVNGLVTLSPGSGTSVATLVGNVFGSGLTLGGNWGNLVRSGNYLYGGTVTDTTTGNKVTLDPQQGNRLNDLIIDSPATTSAFPLDARANAPGSSVTSRVANFSSSNNSSAALQIATAVPNSSIFLSLSNGGGTPTASLFAESGVASLTTSFDAQVFASRTGTTYLDLSSALATVHTPLAVMGPIKTAGYTVSGLPVAPGTGAKAYVTDATACTFGGALTGGGSTYCPVTFNGTSWQGG